MSLSLQSSEVMNPYFSITSQVFESIFHKPTLGIAIFGPLVKMAVTQPNQLIKLTMFNIFPLRVLIRRIVTINGNPKFMSDSICNSDAEENCMEYTTYM